MGRARTQGSGGRRLLPGSGGPGGSSPLERLGTRGRQLPGWRGIGPGGGSLSGGEELERRKPLGEPGVRGQRLPGVVAGFVGGVGVAVLPGWWW